MQSPIHGTDAGPPRRLCSGGSHCTKRQHAGCCLLSNWGRLNGWFSILDPTVPMVTWIASRMADCLPGSLSIRHPTWPSMLTPTRAIWHSQYPDQPHSGVLIEGNPGDVPFMEIDFAIRRLSVTTGLYRQSDGSTYFPHGGNATPKGPPFARVLLRQDRGDTSVV